jgi:2'-5' RNA ligase
MELMERTHRLFFALWPNDQLRSRMAAAARSLLEGKRARAVPADNLHITLAFLGPVQARRLPSVMAAASAIDAAPFDLTIDRVEAWADADILCLTPASCPSLRALVDRLRVNLLEHQLDPDRKDFRPHVTIGRDWGEKQVEATIGPFAWSADDFVLVESETGRKGSQYRIIGRWPLTAH